MDSPSACDTKKVPHHMLRMKRRVALAHAVLTLHADNLSDASHNPLISREQSLQLSEAVDLLKQAIDLLSAFDEAVAPDLDLIPPLLLAATA